ncbi:zinc ribbon domain-containing protein [Pacificispira sp.]|uniref:zinc ribbon domain-containing protein n=1 Tax=Pacificispira sp. TaxID=2888761 RepID=UPI003B526A31
METLKFFFFTVIIILAGAAIYGWHLGGKNKQQAAESENRIRRRRDFRANDMVISPQNQAGIAVDTSQRKAVLITGHSDRDVPFSNILGSEILIDNATVTSTNRGSQLTGAAVGGLLAGGVGAMIGGLSGSTTSRTGVRKVTLRIAVDDFHRPYHDIDLLDWSHSDKGILPGSTMEGALKEAVQQAELWHGRISSIIRENDAIAATPPAQDAVPTFATFEKVPQAEPPAPSAIAAVGTCSSCGKPVGDAAKFCSSCGTAVERKEPAPSPTFQACRKCTKLLSADVERCPRCGTTVPVGPAPEGDRMAEAEVSQQS